MFVTCKSYVVVFRFVNIYIYIPAKPTQVTTVYSDKSKETNMTYH